MLPTVSVLMPCLNERRYLRDCLTSLLANDYAGEFDITVIDGGSTDGTRDILAEFSHRFPNVRMLSNPKRTAPAAMNLGIRQSTGEIVVRVDAHAWYPKNYISRCVSELLQSGAANVGGVWRILPGTPSHFGWAVAKIQSHRFGVGNAAYRLARATGPKWVDTVPFLCCRRTLFDTVGYFNEKLTRTQDIEFNRRIRNAGGGILLCPDIEITYFARSDLRNVAHHAWKTGLWVILPFLHSDVMPISWRHIAPLAFVIMILATGIAGIFYPGAFLILAFVLAAYLLCAVTAGVQIAIRERDSAYALYAPPAFAAFHISYGVGSLCGVWRVLLAISGMSRKSI
jgi:glycosyltransferase involved in cell wall biosynthesis